MNRENIQKVRDHLAALPPERFDMGNFGWGGPDMGNCGTAACVAGWATRLLRPGDKGDPEGIATELFGLDAEDEQAFDLFYAIGRPRYVQLEDITLPQAVRCLEILLETGEVKWERAIVEVDEGSQTPPASDGEGEADRTQGVGNE